MDRQGQELKEPAIAVDLWAAFNQMFPHKGKSAFKMRMPATFLQVICFKQLDVLKQT